MKVEPQTNFVQYFQRMSECAIIEKKLQFLIGFLLKNQFLITECSEAKYALFSFYCDAIWSVYQGEALIFPTAFFQNRFVSELIADLN